MPFFGRLISLLRTVLRALIMGLQQIVQSIRDSLAASGDRGEYTPLADPDRNARLTTEQREKARRWFKLAMVGIVATLIVFFAATYGTSRPPPCESLGNCTETSSHVWGQYSPYFPVPSEIDSKTPPDCKVTFVSVLARHGARDPTAHKTELYKGIIERIQSSVDHYGKGFEFLRDFRFTLGQDQLTEFGVQQLVDAGREFQERYGSLEGDGGMFVRVAGSQRVIESGTNFTKGFYEAKGDKGLQKHLDKVLTIPEEDGYNNTLNHGSCPAFEDIVDDFRAEKQSEWKEAWVPAITNRLNHKLPGANLTSDETIYMMDLCPFHVVADPKGKRSQFCNLFSENEWRSYDYFMSLDKWYGYGAGNPLGPSQGVGYVNELIARLTGQPVDDSTSSNTTLSGDPKTFPLDRKLYADFSHDNTMSSIYAAMGLWAEQEDLPTTHKVAPADVGGFSAAWTVPFAGRMYVEKLQCEGEEEEKVRIVLNDRVVPVKGCGLGERGMCGLEAFVQSMAFARDGGRWADCYKKKEEGS